MAMVASLPIVLYYYSPDVFGVFGTFSSFVGFFAFAACLNYHGSLFLVHSKEDERQIYRLCATCALASTGLAAIIYGAYYLWGGLVWEAGILSVGLFSLTVFVRAMVTASNALAVKRGAIGLAATAQIVRGISVPTIWLVPVLVLSDPPSWGLIVGFSIGNLFALLAFLPLIKTVILPVNPAPKMAVLARRFWRFPTFETPAVFLRQAAQNGPIVLYGLLYGPVEAGLTALATHAAIRPASLLVYSTGQVLHRRYAKMRGPDNDPGTLQFRRRSIIIVAALAVGGGVCLAIVAWPVALWILPQDWVGIAPVLMATAPRLTAIAAIRPVITFASVDEKNELILIHELTATAAMAFCIYLSWLLQADFVANTLVLSLTMLLVTCFFLWRLFRFRLVPRTANGPGSH